jgi:hypothetical protein
VSQHKNAKHSKNVLFDIVKVNDSEYEIKGVKTDEPLNDEAKKDEQVIISTIQALNAIHNVFNDDNITKQLIDDKLDPYEVYFNEIDRLIFEQKTKSGGGPCITCFTCRSR